MRICGLADWALGALLCGFGVVATISFVTSSLSSDKGAAGAFFSGQGGDVQEKARSEALSLKKFGGGSKSRICGTAVPSSCDGHINWAYGTGQHDAAHRHEWYPSLVAISGKPWGSATWDEVRHALYCDRNRLADCNDQGLTPMCDSEGSSAPCPLGENPEPAVVASAAQATPNGRAPTLAPTKLTVAPTPSPTLVWSDEQVREFRTSLASAILGESPSSSSSQSTASASDDTESRRRRRGKSHVSGDSKLSTAETALAESLADSIQDAFEERDDFRQQQRRTLVNETEFADIPAWLEYARSRHTPSMAQEERDAVSLAFRIFKNVRFNDECKFAFADSLGLDEASGEQRIVTVEDVLNPQPLNPAIQQFGANGELVLPQLKKCFASNRIKRKMLTNRTKRARRVPVGEVWLDAIPGAGATNIREKLVSQLSPSYVNARGRNKGEENLYSPRLCQLTKSGRVRFVAARDPWQRFVSAFREIAGNHGAWCKRFGITDCSPQALVLNPNIINEFVKTIVEGGYRHSNIMSQSSFLFSYSPKMPDYVTHIEQGADGWRSFMIILGLTDIANEDDFQYPHLYKKPHRFDYSIWMTTESWKRFCQYYKQDYACLMYPPREECLPGGRGYVEN